MHDMPDNNGPILGESAPFFQKRKGEGRVIFEKLQGSWVILFSHPEDLLTVFKTRTMSYILCKRRVKAVAISDRPSPDASSGRNIFGKYMVKHSLTVIDDEDNEIAKRYGLYSASGSVPLKGVFVVDPKSILRIKLFFSQETERDFTEILKLVDALQTADKQQRQKIQEAGSKGFKLKLNNLIMQDIPEKR